MREVTNTQKLQRAAALARAGHYEEALALRDEVDASPPDEPTGTGGGMYCGGAASPTNPLTVTHLPTGEQVTATIMPGASQWSARQNAIKFLSAHLAAPTVAAVDCVYGPGPAWLVVIRGVAE